MASPRFKSEVFVPIHQDAHTFEERQKDIWSDMHERMERRRREWESEVERMRKDFFKLKPEENRKGSTENLLETHNLKDIFYDKPGGAGDKRFQISFDVSQFSPEEISVRTQELKLIVNAKHEEHGGGSNVSREFSREVDIPSHVDPQKLRCTLSNDGILTIEAQVPAPMYDKIQQATKLGKEAAPPAHTSRLTFTPGASNSLSSTPSGFKDGSMVTEQDGSRTFRIVVDIGSDFTPQDLTVKTVDRKLAVHARHEVKMPGRTSFKEFSREFDLPDTVNPDDVTAAMTEDGKLILEAPMASYTKGSYTGKPGSTKQPTVTISFQKK